MWISMKSATPWTVVAVKNGIWPEQFLLLKCYKHDMEEERVHYHLFALFTDSESVIMATLREDQCLVEDTNGQH